MRGPSADWAPVCTELVLHFLSKSGAGCFPCCLALPSIPPSPLPSLQSDREKSEGLPVAPFMDRDKVTKATAQIGFIKFVLIPMFETVTKVSGHGPCPRCWCKCMCMHTPAHVHTRVNTQSPQRPPHWLQGPFPACLWAVLPLQLSSWTRCPQAINARLLVSSTFLCPHRPLVCTAQHPTSMATCPRPPPWVTLCPKQIHL